MSEKETVKRNCTNCGKQLEIRRLFDCNNVITGDDIKELYACEVEHEDRHVISALFAIYENSYSLTCEECLDDRNYHPMGFLLPAYVLSLSAQKEMKIKEEEE